MRQVQGLLDSVKQKVRTARDITAGLEITDEPIWALESERILEEKQELISRLIVQSQQAFFMAKVSNAEVLVENKILSRFCMLSLPRPLHFASAENSVSHLVCFFLSRASNWRNRELCRRMSTCFN